MRITSASHQLQENCLRVKRSDPRGEATRIAIAGAGHTPPLLTGRVSFIDKLLRRPFAAAVGLGILLLVITATVIGLSGWINTNKAKPSFTFEKMKVSRLTNVGNNLAVISPGGK